MKMMIVILCYDNGANIVKASRLMQIDHIGCIRYGLHLVLETFLTMSLDKKGKSKKNDDDGDNPGEDDVGEYEEEELIGNQCVRFLQLP